jgi:hypothetical protein
MSSEALNLTSKLIETPQKKVVKNEQPLVLKEEVKIPRNDNVNKLIINEAALRQNFVKLNTSKKTCVNILNKRLYSSKKKDMIKNKVIIFSLFFSVGIFGFILG